MTSTEQCLNHLTGLYRRQLDFLWMPTWPTSSQHEVESEVEIPWISVYYDYTSTLTYHTYYPPPFMSYRDYRDTPFYLVCLMSFALVSVTHPPWGVIRERVERGGTVLIRYSKKVFWDTWVSEYQIFCFSKSKKIPHIGVVGLWLVWGSFELKKDDPLQFPIYQPKRYSLGVDLYDSLVFVLT